jgi:GNAT superfamily N-acetyltransferase
MGWGYELREDWLESPVMGQEGFRDQPEERASDIMDDVEIVVGHAEFVDIVEELWKELQAVEAAQAPPGLSALPAAVSWQRRRSNYLRWIELESGSIIVARRGPDVVGYAFLRVEPADDMWVTGGSVVEIETLVVDQSVRGMGIGSAILDRVEIHCKTLGADVQVGTMVTNARAIRLYERRGWAPRRIVLSRFRRSDP